jgi:uncharacterized membrane protein YdbT with pleckstrin-like domain
MRFRLKDFYAVILKSIGLLKKSWTMAASDQEGMEEGSSGSWLPLLVIFVALFFRWAAYGQGNVPIRMRRWYNLQVRMKKCLNGVLDESPASSRQTVV